NPPGRSSASPRQSPSPAADAPAPTARLPVPPLRETPARSRTPPPPPARPAHETAENTAAVPASRWSPVPPVQSCLLLPAPSCNRISGEDLRQRVDHLVPPSGLVLRARTLPLEARLFGLHYI